MSDRAARLALALRSLDGLSIGDAFGEGLAQDPPTLLSRLERRILPDGQWRYTDDTIMAMSVVETLGQHGRIDQDDLARRFGRKFALDTWRGYGRATHEMLQQISRGHDWRPLSAAAFGGAGSMGNGGAMRAAPIGAYYAGDLETAAAQARLAAAVTRAHAEGQAGAMAVAVAAAWVAGSARAATGFFDAVLAAVPPGETHEAIAQASTIPADTDVLTVVSLVGNGIRTVAQDTVPFALWCVRHHVDDYVAALWTAATGLGDCDTLCAIVGGIVATGDAGRGIPDEWRRRREPLSTFTTLG